MSVEEIPKVGPLQKVPVIEEIPFISSNPVQIITNDKKTFILPPDKVHLITIISNLVQLGEEGFDAESGTDITYPINVSSNIFEYIFKYINLDDSNFNPSDDEKVRIERFEFGKKELFFMNEVIPTIPNDHYDTVFNIFLAIVYLDMGKLQKSFAEYFSNNIRGKTVAQIRLDFNVPEPTPSIEEVVDESVGGSAVDGNEEIKSMDCD